MVSIIGWHYIHRAPGAFNPELPLAQRRLMPEWAHLRTQQRARPKRGTEDQTGATRAMPGLCPALGQRYLSV